MEQKATERTVERFQWPIGTFGVRCPVKGLELKKFNNWYEIKKQSSAWSVDLAYPEEYISKIRGGKPLTAYIPKEELAIGSVLLVCVEMSFAIVQVIAITEYQVEIKTWPITSLEARELRRTRDYKSIIGGK